MTVTSVEKALRELAYTLAREYCPTHKDTQHIFVDGFMAAVKQLMFDLDKLSLTTTGL